MSPADYTKNLEHKGQIACGMAFDYGALVFLTTRFVRGAALLTEKECTCVVCAERRALKVFVASLV